jgi:hypothetical protein
MPVLRLDGAAHDLRRRWSLRLLSSGIFSCRARHPLRSTMLMTGQRVCM